MRYVIERDRQYYGGMVDGRPVWLESRRPETQFDAELAEKVLQQLTALGFIGCELKLYAARVRKERGR